MRFWDPSALIPLLLRESTTPSMRTLLEEDPDLAVWWGCRVECASAIARRVREGVLSSGAEAGARERLNRLSRDWHEVAPSERLRELAESSLRSHPLRAADALQLAAALRWSFGIPVHHGFVCLDDRLREAARAEGFSVLP